MNTNQLKRFAQEARIKLLKQVEAKLSFVLTSDTPELREKTEQVKQLKDELHRTGKAQLIEKVAYTWFNRLMALRFMDANDYQPLGIRIITPKDGYVTPELLDEAKRGNIPDELKLNRQRVLDLLDNRITSTNPQNEAYKELLIAACNHLNSTLPFLFEKISDYSELLLPDDLTSDFSIVTDFRNGIQKEDCENVEVVGWLYQFYISVENDRLIKSKKVYQKNELAPASQLFTPKWIVRYMVDNTLGQILTEYYPKTKITEQLEFYIKPAYIDQISHRQTKKLEEIKFFDPCVGSAHILSYAFDVFYLIYKELGYSENEIPEFIIKYNLFGTDIDERAAQIASLVLMMKGRQYYRRFLKKKITPNIAFYSDFEFDDKFKNASAIGSLIQVEPDEIETINIDANSLFGEKQKELKQLYRLLGQRYDLVVTNPPYISSSRMEGSLKQYVESNYQDTKSDLFATFILRCLELCNEDGLTGYMTPFVWMFISSYEKLRKIIIDQHFINNLIQLEYSGFDGATVPICTFTLRKNGMTDAKGSYIRLSDFKGHQNQAPKTLEAIQNPNCGWFYTANQNDFEKIPGSPIGFWASKKLINAFTNGTKISQYGKGLTGLQTGNTEKYLRQWSETSFNNIGISVINRNEAQKTKLKWFKCSKGGAFRKWYGNRDFVVNWIDDGHEVKTWKKNQLALGKITANNSKCWNQDYYFKEGIAWNLITSSVSSFRYYEDGVIFDISSPTLFLKNQNDLDYLLAFFNSKISFYVAKLLSPTINFSPGLLSSFPVLGTDNKLHIEKIVQNCIVISKYEWNCREISWDFLQNELIRIKGQDLEESFDLYQQYWKNKFFQLHKNEEELNRQFIEIYGLQGELTPDVPLEDITILQEELDRKALAKLNNKLARHPETQLVSNYHELELPFVASELMEQFISYAVGCMFGRYSLDKEGLILANQGETVEDYLVKIGTSTTLSDLSFVPDEDNIIPILDEEWFEDDIVARFHKFLKVTFGEANFSKNLAFVEEQLGKDIRKYFTKDFYSDHIKRYKKRPIYWMFSSPKGSFNVLIYMHRYTPDTVSNILNKYLREFSGKLKTRLETLEHIKVSGTASEKTKAIKESDSIDKMLIDLYEYERDILYPIATERIAIDLDDGVLVNYNKFGKAIKDVAGLNDKKTKEKVKGFDWIDATQIR